MESRTGGSAYDERGWADPGESIWRPDFNGQRRCLERANEVAKERERDLLSFLGIES